MFFLECRTEYVEGYTVYRESFFIDRKMIIERGKNMPNQNRRLFLGKLFIVIRLFGILSTQAIAANFDCTRANTEREKLVCSDPQLSKLDEELTSIYNKALKETDDKEWLKKRQRKWLDDVDFRLEFKSHDCDITCLKEAYIERIAQLAFLMKVKDLPPLKTIKSDEEICRQIRTEIETKGPLSFSYDSSGKKLGTLCGPPSVKCEGDADEIPIKKLISNGLVPSQIQLGEIDQWFTHVTEIDVNNDGLPDLWLSQTSGSLYYQDNEFLLRTKEGTYIHSIYFNTHDFSGLCSGDRLSPRQIDGLIYLVIAREAKSFVYLLQPSGKPKEICSFIPEWTPAQEEIADMVRKKYPKMPANVTIMRPQLITLTYDDPPYGKKGEQVWYVEANCMASAKPHARFIVDPERKDIKPYVKPGEDRAGSCDF